MLSVVAGICRTAIKKVTPSQQSNELTDFLSKL